MGEAKGVLLRFTGNGENIYIIYHVNFFGMPLRLLNLGRHQSQGPDQRQGQQGGQDDGLLQVRPSVRPSVRPAV